ncbi:MAG: CoA transferase [Pseudomonadota bacterium]
MDNELAFEGLKVVDFSQGVAGPHCGMLLALNGADVIKLEPPAGDWGRAIGKQHGDFSAYNMAFNRGKRSLAIDVKDPNGFEAARRLALAADVIVENNRPGVMQRLGLDYEAVRRRNDDVIYVSVTGFGQAGPRNNLPATDSVMQAFSGLMSVNLDYEGTPQRIGVLVIDVVTGLYAFQAVSTALYRRVTRGGGKHISVSLMQSIAAVQAGKMVEFALEGAGGQKPGVPVGTYPTADGYITVNARRDAHFRSLMALVGKPNWADDPKFATSEARVSNEAALTDLLREAMPLKTSAQWSEALSAADILNAPVNDYRDYFDDVHVKDTHSLAWVEHPSMGTVPIPEVPGTMSVGAQNAFAKSPALGEHSVEILRELEFDESDIEAMIAGRVLKCASAA